MIILYKAEILELSGNYAKENKVKRITSRHFRLAVSLDQELNTVKNILQFNLDKTVPLFFFLTTVIKTSNSSWCRSLAFDSKVAS